MNKNIIVKGAREHNLKNIDIEIPRDKLVVFKSFSLIICSKKYHLKSNSIH